MAQQGDSFGSAGGLICLSRGTNLARQGDSFGSAGAHLAQQGDSFGSAG